MAVTRSASVASEGGDLSPVIGLGLVGAVILAVPHQVAIAARAEIAAHHPWAEERRLVLERGDRVIRRIATPVDLTRAATSS